MRESPSKSVKVLRTRDALDSLCNGLCNLYLVQQGFAQVVQVLGDVRKGGGVQAMKSLVLVDVERDLQVAHACTQQS